MAHPVFIAGASLASALKDPADIYSGEQHLLALDVLEQAVDIPFLAIKGHPLDDASRMQAITRQVLDEAIDEAGWRQAELDDCAVFIGSTSFSLYDTELLYQEVLDQNLGESPLTVTSYTMLPDYIQQHFTPRAQFFTYNTACTSSGNALLYAGKMIRSGRIRHAIVVGMEFFNQTTLLGFHALGLISKSAHMQPFGINRDGLALGEGCSAVLLSADKPANGSHWQLSGGATLGDTHSMTAANPDGSSIERVIRQALKNAAVDADAIRAVKLHGTASLANDDVEYLGLERVYSDRIPPACVLKPAIGHTLGACGSNELVILMRYLQQGFLPGLARPYPLDDNLPVGISAENRAMQPGHFLLNFFGFGGNNTTLIISNLP